MGFLGPVARVGDALVRPHELTVELEPGAGAAEAMVGRVVHLGFEVRLELALRDGSPLTAQLTRAEAAALELRRGDIVYVRTAAAGAQATLRAPAAPLGATA
jgi:sulfate transport system ATP-binding protein